MARGRRIQWTTHEQAAREEARYWRSQSPQARLAAVETIRRAAFALYGGAPKRVERVYRLSTLESRAIPDRRSSRAGSGGKPRFTRGLDILVEPTRVNAVRVCRALSDYGYSTLAREVEAFATPDRMATLGRQPLRIDIMTSITGVTFKQAWAGRTLIKLGSRKVAFLGIASLKKNKLASGRPKDLADIAMLEESEDRDD